MVYIRDLISSKRLLCSASDFMRIVHVYSDMGLLKSDTLFA